MQENNGLNVTLLKKLEIRPTVEVVGHLLLLKQLVIEFALQADKLYKLEFQQKICLLVVQLVDKDVMEETPLKLSHTTIILVFAQEIYTKTQIGANRIL